MALSVSKSARRGGVKKTFGLFLMGQTSSPKF
jgi:hypothetical protein